MKLQAGTIICRPIVHMRCAAGIRARGMRVGKECGREREREKESKREREMWEEAQYFGIEFGWRALSFTETSCTRAAQDLVPYVDRERARASERAKARAGDRARKKRESRPK